MSEKDPFGLEITPEFKAWLDQLNEAAKQRGYQGWADFWQTTGAECWFESYEDGSTPLQALIEDESYA